METDPSVSGTVGRGIGDAAGRIGYRRDDGRLHFFEETAAAVTLIRTRIKLLAQPKSMCSIIDATQREQRYGLA